VKFKGARRAKGWQKALAVVVAVLAVEAFVFNAPFWESLTFGPSQAVQVEAGAGLEVQGNTYTVTSTDDATLYISGFDADPDNVYLELAEVDAEGVTGGPLSAVARALSAGTTYTLSMAAVDADGGAFTFPETTISTGIAETQYVRIHSLTASQTLRVTFTDAAVGTQFCLLDAQANVVRPFAPNAVRVLVMLALAGAVAALRPGSRLYRRQLDFDQRWQCAAMAGVLVLGIVGACGLGTLTDQNRLVETGAYFDSYLVHEKDENQYNHLADAFLAGRVSLDLPVSDILLELDNPYDTAARTALNAEAHDAIYWDYAYYNGSYYCYFGALPVLLTFLPFKALTGADLPTWAAAMIFAAALCLTMFFLLKKLRDVYFPRTTFGAFTLALLLCYSSWGIIEQMFLPRIYAVPMLSALTFASLGVALWLCAKQRMNRQNVPNMSLATPPAAAGTAAGAQACTSDTFANTNTNTKANASGAPTHHVRYLIAGATCVALTLGCRPSFILTAVLAFGIFWPEITSKRLFFSRKGAGNTAAVIVPFLVVAVPVMMYNAARFGSPFDFGANYNLTGGDMTARGLSIGRVPVGLFEYLLQPLNVHPVFPFINSLSTYITYSGYMGPVSSEPFYGGLLALCPALWLGVFTFARRRTPGLAGTGAVGLAGCAAVLALVIVMLDIQVSGTVMRYFADFAWLISLGAVFAIWTLMTPERMHETVNSNLHSSKMPKVSLATCPAVEPNSASGAHALPGKTHPRMFAHVIVGLIFAGFVLYGWTLLGTERFDALITTCPTVYYTLKSWLIPFC
jgi:hypothetical protein